MSILFKTILIFYIVILSFFLFLSHSDNQEFTAFKKN